MATMGVTIGANSPEIRKAILEKVNGPIISLTKNPQVLAQIANRAKDIMTPYVPAVTGTLRKSAHVVQHARQTKVVWGQRGVGHDTKYGYVDTTKYARFQYFLKSENRTDKATNGYWDEHIARGTPGFEQLVEYATPLVKKEVRNGSR